MRYIQNPMKLLPLTRWASCLLYCLLATATHAQVSPLPPLNTDAVWEIKAQGQIGFRYDTIAYGQRYCRCGYDYVALVLNGADEVLYLRQTEDKAYYLLDIADCDQERLLYDYSTATPQIPVRSPSGIVDSFDVIRYASSPLDTVGPLRLPRSVLHFSYPFGPFTISTFTLWIRGVGDVRHPFFPLFYAFNSSGTEITYSLHRLTVDHVVWYDSQAEQSQPSVIYVDRDATGGLQDGSSWANAHTDLSAALQLARAGDMVWVAEGVYTPTGGTDRGASFELRDRIKLYGGFNATETHLSDRTDPALHPTVLSGDIGVVGDSTDNTYHILRIQDVRDFAVLDGFTIRDGNAMGGGVAFPFIEAGAGILIYSTFPAENKASIVLKSNILAYNTAPNGAAMSIDDGYAVPLALRITQCSIRHNYAFFRAGGFYLPESLTQPVEVSLQDTEFRDNRFNTIGGGAIYDYHSGTRWDVVNTVFAENGTTTGAGGGAWALFQTAGDKQINLLNCEFRDNFCRGSGAGLEYYHFGGASHLSLKMEKTTFLRNESFANDGAAFVLGALGDQSAIDFLATECLFADNKAVLRGAAAYVRLDGNDGDGHVRFDRCVFRNNRGRLSSQGGAFNGEIDTPDDPTLPGRVLYLHFTNSLFVGNKGAITQEQFSARCGIVDSIINCTFVDNAPITFAKGYAPGVADEIQFSDIYIKNSIIWEPRLPLWQILYNGNSFVLSVNDYELDHCLISVDSCDLPGGDQACQTFPNWFKLDPQFVDTLGGDYRLKHCSPFVNRGADVSALGAFDLGGLPRLQDGILDVGAYETGRFSTSITDAFTRLACATDSTGLVAVSTTNGTAPIEYTLAGPGGRVSDTAGLFDELPAGAYQVLVADGQACHDTLSVVIEAPLPLGIHTTAAPYTSEAQRGAVQLDSITGGTLPYELFFDSSPWDGAPITGLEVGSYLVQCIDAQGCQIDTLVEVSLLNSIGNLQNSPFAWVVSPNPVSAGSPVNVAFSAIGQAPYQLEIWSVTGQKVTSATIANSPSLTYSFTPTRAGLYIAVIRDAEGRPVAEPKIVVQ